MYLGLYLLGLDLTVLNVAAPDLQNDLHAHLSQVQWVVNGYTLALGGTVLAVGAMTDRIGRRRAFTAGLALCAAASAAGALASGVTQVIAARFAMGTGASLLMPATLSTVISLFPEPQLRQRAIALWAAVGGIGFASGPVAGGWLVEHHGWRAGFWINLPIAATAIVLAYCVVPESRDTERRRVDLTGAVLSAAGLLTLVWAVIEAPTRGWTSTTVLAAFTVATGWLAAFLVHQSRSAAPMLPLAFLRDPRIGVAAATLATLSLALYGALLVVSLYLQEVLGYSPWQAGVRTLPLPLALAAGAVAVVPQISRWGARATVVSGLALVVAAFVVLAGATPESGYPRVAVFQIIAGFGAGMAATAGTGSVMGAVPAQRAALGSAINDATRQVGSAVGVALQGSILASVSASSLHRSLSPYSAQLPEAARADILSTRLYLADVPPALRSVVLASARQAFIDGLITAALVAGALTLAAGAAAAVWLPRRSTSCVPGSEVDGAAPRDGTAESCERAER